LTKLVLTAACLAAAPPVFQPAERWRDVLVHEQACQVLEAHGVSGVRYLPLEVIADPLFAGPKVVALEQTVREQPNDALAWRDLGSTRLLLLHQPADGLAALDRALQLSGDDARTWEWRGGALKQLGRFEEALAAFRRAVELDPQNAAPLEWSSLLCQLGRNDEALAVAQAGVAARPRYPRMWHQLGAAQMALGADAAALEAFERGMAAGGGPYEELLRDRSAALFHLGRLEAALAAYEQGLRFRPTHVEMLRGKAQVLRVLGREAEAAAAERSADEAEGVRQWAAERIL
jgi:tetratricopeptide (TPR) repeat protein